MAETVKKIKTAKAPAKPRKAPTKKAAILTMESPKPVAHEDVARLAHQFWSERGFQHGHDEEDWFRAEQALSAKAS